MIKEKIGNFKTVLMDNERKLPVSFLMLSLVCAVVVFALSVNIVKISDGEKNYTVHTFGSDIESAVSTANLKSSDFEIVSKTVNGRTSKVKVMYTFPVYITVGDRTVTVKTSGGTVSDILKLAGYSIDEHDIVEPAADKIIGKTGYIDFTDIDYVSNTCKQAIPYKIVTVYSSAQPKGVVTTLSGVEGVEEVTYTSKVVNGVEVDKTVTSVTTLSNAVNGKNIVGTGAAQPSLAAPQAAGVITSDLVKCVSTLKPANPISLDSNGNPVNYTKVMTVQATAYTYTGHNCAIGVAPQPGYIAVNPAVIPYGTRMYIKTADGGVIYGYAIAADTGGFVRNNPTNVDLFYPTKSACKAFGRRAVQIYILP